MSSVITKNNAHVRSSGRIIAAQHKHAQLLSRDGYSILTPIDIQLSSGPDGNLHMNFEPAFSSESFKGLNRQTTFMLSSAAISRSRCSPDIFITLKTLYTENVYFSGT